MSNEWKNVADQQGIEDLMKTFGGFHDSCITSLFYESGLFVDPQGAMGMGTPRALPCAWSFIANGIPAPWSCASRVSEASISWACRITT